MTDGDHKQSREQRVYDEAVALWRELYAEPPPVRTDGGMILDIIMQGLPETGYDRLRSPYLRPATLVRPRPEAARAG